MQVHLLTTKTPEGAIEVDAFTQAKIEASPEGWAQIIEHRRAEVLDGDGEVVEFGVLTVELTDEMIEAAFARARRGPGPTDG